MSETIPPTVINSVGAGIAIPLFTGNDFEGDIRGSMAEMTQAEIAMLQTGTDGRYPSPCVYLQELDQANARFKTFARPDIAVRAQNRQSRGHCLRTGGHGAAFEYLEAEACVTTCRDCMQ